jgi:hypothetical protein
MAARSSRRRRPRTARRESEGLVEIERMGREKNRRE